MRPVPTHPFATTDSSASDSGLKLLVLALAAVALTHGALLPFTHANTYDAFIHMFFGDHYRRSWFDPWEPRWYTGFATTSYPPGTHMLIGALSMLMPLRAAFVVAMLTGLMLLTLGVYRFALIWVGARAAGYAALALVLSSSIWETVHLFGQLPTIFSLGVFLNGLPWAYRWIVAGGWRNMAAAVLFGAATTAAHHVTTLFGCVLFLIPLGLQALRAAWEIGAPGAAARAGSTSRDVLDRPRPLRASVGAVRRLVGPVGRVLVLAVLLGMAMGATIFPYWVWSIRDPITQVPIPHGSRESFLARPDLGLMFFVLPWGASLITLPYALWKGATSRLWPLAGSVALCFLLGTGGTTPLPRKLLGGAFDILTLDRFTFWATILILPFTGFLAESLLHGRAGRSLEAALGLALRRLLVGGLFLAYVGGAILCAVLPALRPTQPAFIDPAPIVSFLDQDQHDRWRYLTLGFGDQFAYVSALTRAQSVDGNYHSARRLPDLTAYSVERLENAKYLGVPGLGSLTQFVTNPDRYHLKYIFSNDAFYDPLLTFAGWNALNRLPGGVVIWERPDVAPLPLLQPRQDLPVSHRLIWGLAPPTALIAAALVLGWTSLRRSLARPRPEDRPVLQPEGDCANPARTRAVVMALAVALCLGLAGLAALGVSRALTPMPPEAVITAYFTDLDFRRPEAAYARLDPETRGTFEEARFPWRWRGGLIASYGKLTGITARPLRQTGDRIDWQVRLDWLSSLATRTEVLNLRTIRRDGRWYVVPTGLRPVQSPLRLGREAGVSWNVTGRRQPLPDPDLHRDRADRPRLQAGPARLVRHQGRFALVGAVRNDAAEPAHLTVTGQLLGRDGAAMVTTEAGLDISQRLLPAETGAFRVTFEGALSLADARAGDGYDPRRYSPPRLPEAPAGAALAARALVTGANLYRGISLNGVTTQPAADGGVTVTGTAVNAGLETASVVRIVAALADAQGRPVWVEAGYVDTNIPPGQSAPFRLTLPARATIEVLAEIAPEAVEVNGLSPALPGAGPAPDLTAGAMALNGLGGHAYLRLDVSAMTYDPEF